jgi:hypothetical protein
MLPTILTKNRAYFRLLDKIKNGVPVKVDPRIRRIKKIGV